MYLLFFIGCRRQSRELKMQSATAANQRSSLGIGIAGTTIRVRALTWRSRRCPTQSWLENARKGSFQLIW